MRPDRTSIAVWILSLVTDPDRAATTAGDFAEEASAHQPTWFWWQIATTLSAHVVHDSTQALGPFVWGFLRGWGLSLLAVVVLLPATLPLQNVWDDLYYSFFPPPPGNWLPPAPGFVAFIRCYGVVVNIFYGRWIARFTGRPLAAWMLSLVLSGAMWSLKTLAGWRPYEYGMSGVYVLAVLVGVIWERRRSLKIA